MSSNADHMASPAGLRRLANDLAATAAVREVPGQEPSWLERVRTAAHALAEVVQGHRGVTEDEGGMLPNAVRKRPGVMTAAERLAVEHADMQDRAGEIETEALRQIASKDFNLELVRLQVRVLEGMVLLHLVRTGDLLHEAYVRVDGGEGG